VHDSRRTDSASDDVRSILVVQTARGGRDDEGADVGLEDMVGQAKDLIGGIPGGSDAVDGAVDKVADVIEERTPEQIDGAVEQAAQAIKDQI
jgi:hypothetical protein